MAHRPLLDSFILGIARLLGIRRKRLTIAEFGWSKEQAANIRSQFTAFIEGWDDPEMDVYNDLL